MGEPRRASGEPPRPTPLPPESGPALRVSTPPPSAVASIPTPARPLSVIPASPASSVPPSAAFRGIATRADEEVILPFRAPRVDIRAADSFRSTWVVSSLRSLGERGHLDRYREHLRSHEHEVLECVAGTWLPLEVARAHYEACDALGLGADEQIAMGRAVGAQAQGSILATTVKVARGIGATPWTILPQLDRLWLRGANGGATAVFKLGPKEARIEVVGCALFDLKYFRNAFRGVLLGIGEMFCQTGHVHEIPRRIAGECHYLVQWV